MEWGKGKEEEYEGTRLFLRLMILTQAALLLGIDACDGFTIFPQGSSKHPCAYEAV